MSEQNSRKPRPVHETRCLPFPARVFRGTGRKPGAHDRHDRTPRPTSERQLAFPATVLDQLALFPRGRS